MADSSRGPTPCGSDTSISDKSCVTGSQRRPTSHRILLAEDQPEARAMLKHMLDVAGFEVTAVENGIECVQAAQAAQSSHAPYHLIIMDIQMPGLDGNGAAWQIRVNGYSGPIVSLTAKPSEEGCDDSLHSGIDYYLGKSDISGEYLRALVKNLISKTAITNIE